MKPQAIGTVGLLVIDEGIARPNASAKLKTSAGIGPIITPSYLS